MFPAESDKIFLWLSTTKVAIAAANSPVNIIIQRFSGQYSFINDERWEKFLRTKTSMSSAPAFHDSA